MQKITVAISVSKQTDDMFFLMGEITRLSQEKKSYILCKIGKKIYLKTCKGLQKNFYISSVEDNKAVLTVLNYAIALGADIKTSLEGNVLSVDITSQDIHKIKKITVFANSISAPYEIAI